MSTNNIQEEKKVTIKEFVEKYNSYLSDQAKEAYLKSIVKENEKTMYLAKVITADKILKLAHTNENGEIFYNTPKEKQLYLFGILALYTNLEIGADNSNEYDLLSNNNLLDVIRKMIYEKNQNDFDSFDEIFIQRKDDFNKNTNLVRINTEDVVNAVKLGIMQGIDFFLDQVSKLIQDPSFESTIQEFINQVQENEA